jgi:antitoxin component YwqK of YwqJK toxin-antitoxin module
MKALSTFLFMAIFLSVSAQDGVIVKYFDSSWNPTSIENASFYTHFKKQDTIYSCTSYYAKSNKLYGKSTFADTLFTRGKGRGLMLRYYQNGGLKDSTIFNNYGYALTLYEFYENGNSKKVRDTIKGGWTTFRAYFPNGNLKDSSFNGKKIEDYYYSKFYETGNLDTLICFNKDSNSLVINTFDKIGNPTSKKRMSDSDLVFTSIQIIASFPGGPSAWKKYLEQNLQGDLPWRNGAPKGRYTVIVSFLVEKDGSISEVKTENNPGFGTSEESIRVVCKGPKWKPAMQNGRTVKYRARQSITFLVN